MHTQSAHINLSSPFLSGCSHPFTQQKNPKEPTLKLAPKTISFFASPPLEIARSIDIYAKERESEYFSISPTRRMEIEERYEFTKSGVERDELV